jgi:mannosyltransferase
MEHIVSRETAAESLAASNGEGALAAAAAARRPDLREIAVVAPTLYWRFSGRTATIIALVPRQAREVPIAGLGPFLPRDVPQIRFRDLLRHGWSRPPGGLRHRIWHARRNDEMIVGLFLKHVLRQPWKLVFTSAAQRRHTEFTHWLMRRMDRLIATSEGAAACLELPATVIHHGVDTSRFRPAESRAEAWRSARLPGGFGVGAFGRIRRQKGTDLVVEAMIRLLPKYPDAVLVLTGLITNDNKAFAAELERRVAAAGLQDRILFLGERPRDEMPEWFRRVRLYVAPMRNEGFGITPLEAMASGAAVVATKTGAAVQLVQDGATGVLAEPDDLDSLVASIEPLLADPGRADEMGRRGRAKALQHHDVDVEAARINEVYRRVWSGP